MGKKFSYQSITTLWQITYHRMATKTPEPNCRVIRICVDTEIEDAIIHYQLSHKLKTGKRNYLKHEAAADMFRELMRKQKNHE